jgi:tellurite resistance protein TehA-like permease
MHPERLVIARVSAVVAAIVTIIVVAAAVGASGSLLIGHLFPIVQIIVFSSGGRPRARATIIGIVAAPIVLRLGRHLFIILPLHASDARRPSNGSRDVLLFNGVARCDSFGQDTPSATDASGSLDLYE